MQIKGLQVHLSLGANVYLLAVLGSMVNEVWEQTFQWVGRVGEVVMVLFIGVVEGVT